MMTDYTPIDCGLYSEYELAILREKRLRVFWREPRGMEHMEVLVPRDLLARNQEEFLVAEDLNGHALKVRLDYIIRAEAL